ncbi:solute carrier family 2, facilitated glucose transporter member 9-like isoform X3 [Dromaius novaehollandiae]|uniref:solute carrier family 2, facilitated glucose transporter member 9-like isoform X3 n=1 Tax=Dromaius novaehollandiae TaxID=8790 RepID=UPI00311F8346
MSQAERLGLPSSPPPLPPSPFSDRGLTLTDGKGTRHCGGAITGRLTFPLLSVTLLVSFGSSTLYGYNLAVVNAPAASIKAFYNATWSQRYGHGLAPGPLTLLYSLTVSFFALGGLLGSVLVGVLVARYGRSWGSRSCWARTGTGPSSCPWWSFLPSSSSCCCAASPRARALRRFLGTADVQDEIEEMREEQRALSSVETLSVWQLLRDRSVRWQTLSVAVVNAGMQLSGIDAIWFYTNTIFKDAGIPVPQIPYVTVGTGAVEIIAGLIGCVTVEKLGRRPLVLAGFCAMGLCSAGITGCRLLQAALPGMRYVAVACVVGIIAGFCTGPAGVPFLLTAELFTQAHRPAAYIVGGSLNWLSNFTVGFVFPFLQMSAGAFCYLFFCGVCLLVAIYVYLVIPETKNKTFVEISQIFAARRSFLSAPAQLIRMMKLSGYGALDNSSLEGLSPQLL